jgi:hypothetical protein
LNDRAAEAKAKLESFAAADTAHGDFSGKPGEELPAQTGLAHETRIDNLVAKECLSLVDLVCLTYKEFVLEFKRVHENGDAYVNYYLQRFSFA